MVLTCVSAVQAEADSQVQLYRAQISKMQLALERADQENSRVEQELRIALEAPGKLREAQAEKRAGSSSLAVLRDRVRSMSLLAPSAEPRAEERLQVGSNVSSATSEDFCMVFSGMPVYSCHPA